MNNFLTVITNIFWKFPFISKLVDTTFLTTFYAEKDLLIVDEFIEKAEYNIDAKEALEKRKDKDLNIIATGANNYFHQQIGYVILKKDKYNEINVNILTQIYSSISIRNNHLKINTLKHSAMSLIGLLLFSVVIIGAIAALVTLIDQNETIFWVILSVILVFVLSFYFLILLANFNIVIEKFGYKKKYEKLLNLMLDEEDKKEIERLILLKKERP